MSSAVRLSACFSTGSARAPIPRARGRGASAVPQQVRLPTALAAAARGCCCCRSGHADPVQVPRPSLPFGPRIWNASAQCVARCGGVALGPS